MSTTVKFTITDDCYSQLCERAEREKLSIQDYIRKELFREEVLFTPLDAVSKALAQYSKGDFFTVPQIFGSAWDLPNGMAGQFGRKFAALVKSDYNSKIKFTGNYDAKKHAIYTIL